jgi:hypothetical protein
MAWDWSHTNEAYANAYDNLHNSPRDFLVIAFAEWKAKEIEDSDNDNDPFGAEYEGELAFAARLATDTLADAIWDKASEQRTCDNGGYNAWVCPYGCHTVSFDCETVGD